MLAHLMLTLFASLALLSATPRPLAPHVGKEESFAETFSFTADLKDGTYVQVQLAVSNAGWGSQKGACRLLVLAPGQKPIRATITVDKDAWHYSSTSNTLAVGPCKVSGNGTTEVQAELDGSGVVLSIATAPLQIVPPISGIKKGSDYYTTDLVVPWAPATATLLSPNGSTKVIEGHAFADHSRATMLPKDLARGWLRFRGLSGKCPTLFLARFLPDNDAAEAWLFSQGQTAPALLTNLQVALPALNKPVANIVIKDSTRTMTLAPQKEIYRHNPAQDFGLLGKAVGAWVGSVLTATYRAQLDLTGSCGKVDGILEITQVQ